MSEVLTGSDLENSDFRSSNLNYANLVNSYLTDSDFRGSWVHFADLGNAGTDSA